MPIVCKFYDLKEKNIVSVLKRIRLQHRVYFSSSANCTSTKITQPSAIGNRPVLRFPAELAALLDLAVKACGLVTITSVPSGKSPVFPVEVVTDYSPPWLCLELRSSSQ